VKRFMPTPAGSRGRDACVGARPNTGLPGQGAMAARTKWQSKSWQKRGRKRWLESGRRKKPFHESTLRMTASSCALAERNLQWRLSNLSVRVLAVSWHRSKPIEASLYLLLID
jgi:hypothetical protein